MFEDENRHYSLRKLSVGLASVLIGISFASTTGNSVKADTVNSDSNGVQTIVKNSDAKTKIDANAAESNTESAPEATKKDPNAIAQDIKQKAMRASEAVTKLQNTAEKTTKGNAPEAAAKNATDGRQDATESTLKGTNLIAKQQNTAVKGSANTGKDGSTKNDSLTAKNNALKATVEAAKQGLDTPAVSHSDSNETTLNAKGGKAIAEKMIKEGKVEVKNSQYGSDPAKSKLKTTALMAIADKKLNAQMLSELKIMSPAKDTNGGFDSSWGTLDVNDWQGSVQGDYYRLTSYTGNVNHVIVPNEADFEKAGISTSGKQVGVASNLMHTIFADKATAEDTTVAFSKTDNKMVKAINADWSHTWANGYDSKAKLSKFDGTNLDVSNVIDMSGMFSETQISDLSSLAHWDTSNVTDMEELFNGCESLSNISSLSNWNTSNVTDMEGLFNGCKSLSDISSLANWDTSNVTNMSGMFRYCYNLSDISSLAHWDTSKVTDMSGMFDGCESLSNISPLAHWDTSKVTDMEGMFDDCGNLSDISPLANWDTSKVTRMDMMFEDCSNLSDISPLANWDTSNVTTMASMFQNTPLKKVTLTNWDFRNSDPSYGAESIFPDTNFEATLSDKTSKSLLGIASEESDPAKEILKKLDSTPIVDGIPDPDGRIQDGLDSIKQKKEEYQQQLAKYKQQIDHCKKELADPNADAATKENSQDELKQAEQKYQYYLTGDGKKEYDGQIQDLQGELEQYKQELQQEINMIKLQAEYPLDLLFGNLSKITTPSRDLLVYLVGKLPVKSDTATRTIKITFPDGTKKTINQSVGYGKYFISGTADMATHKLDMAMPYELSQWEPIKKEDGSYDLVKAHVDKNGVARFDNVDLPQIPGYKTMVKTASSPVNHANALFAVSFMALPKPVTPAINDVKPAETVTPEAPVAIEVAKPIKTEPKVTIIPKTINLSNGAVSIAPKETTWQVANNLEHNTYHVSNGKYTVELPHISNAQLHVIANDSTKDSILFTYKGQNTKYAFDIKFVNGHYLLTTYKIKSGKLVKLIDYNFVKSSKMIDIILDWLQFR